MRVKQFETCKSPLPIGFTDAQAPDSAILNFGIRWFSMTDAILNRRKSKRFSLTPSFKKARNIPDARSLGGDNENTSFHFFISGPGSRPYRNPNGLCPGCGQGGPERSRRKNLSFGLRSGLEHGRRSVDGKRIVGASSRKNDGQQGNRQNHHADLPLL